LILVFEVSSSKDIISDNYISGLWEIMSLKREKFSLTVFKIYVWIMININCTWTMYVKHDKM